MPVEDHGSQLAKISRNIRYSDFYFGECDPNFGSPDHITTAMCRQKKNIKCQKIFVQKVFQVVLGQEKKHFPLLKGKEWGEGWVVAMI